MKINKFLVLIILMSISQFLLAEAELNDNMTIAQICKTTKIPVRKMAEYLDLNLNNDIHTPVKDLNCQINDIRKAAELYSEGKKEYYIGIVIVGMGTVFASLILVALIIAQLRHLDRKKAPRQSSQKEFAVIGQGNDEENDIVAAIVSTIFLHEQEVEENNKLLLTWKRAPLSMWKASNYIPMNEIDPSRRN
ncbi:MAG: OadG family protein [Candidatus Stygibacter frigidus]|nr:OadG family protein [Candidatus Stygibacter frigidus]